MTIFVSLLHTETFPTCAHLKDYFTKNKAQGETDLVDGNYAVDPDGPGGVDPFMVYCKFPSTIVNIGGQFRYFFSLFILESLQK